MDSTIRGDHIVGDTDRGSRKRKRNLTSKERKSSVRHSDHYPNLEHLVDFACSHPKRKDFFCHELSQDDIRTTRNMCFKTTKKIVQDNKLGHFMDVEKPDRKRSQKPGGKFHNFSTRYHVSFILNNFI
nr:unnamed protein product [Callosobruchus chinensis]